MSPSRCSTDRTEWRKRLAQLDLLWHAHAIRYQIVAARWLPGKQVGLDVVNTVLGEALTMQGQHLKPLGVAFMAVVIATLPQKPFISVQVYKTCFSITT